VCLSCVTERCCFESGIVRVDDRPPVRALILPAKVFGIVPPYGVEHFFTGCGRKGWPEFLEIIQPLIAHPLLFALKTVNNSRQLQGFPQLSRHQHFLAQDLFAVGSGCQNPAQLCSGLQGRFRVKGFQFQCRDLFNS